MYPSQPDSRMDEPHRCPEMMKCNTAHSLLSEAIDQRLPQIEAQALQKHLIACPSCRAEYDSLAQLQCWTRELPETLVAGDFASRLMARIASGEGTPPAVLNMPTPLGTRVRHFAYGAGTAAALLLSAFLVLDGLKDSGSRVPERHDTAVAHSPLPTGLTQISEDEVARRAIEQATTQFQVLQANAPRIVSKFPPRRAVEKLVNESDEVYWITTVARTSSPGAVELPKELSASLEDIEQTCRLVRLRSIHSKDPSRTSKELVELILRPSVPDRKATAVKVRLGAPRFKLDRLVQRFGSDPEALLQIRRTLEKLLDRNTDGVQLFFDTDQGAFQILLRTRGRR